MNFDKYRMPEGSYPEKPKKPIHPARGQETAASIKEYAAAFEGYEKEMSVFKEKMMEYHKAEAALTEQFWKDAFEEIGIPEKHLKAGKLRAKAWEHGHSSGYSDVFCWLEELWELVG